MLTELIGLSLGTFGITRYYSDCPAFAGKKIMFGELLDSVSTHYVIGLRVCRFYAEIISITQTLCAVFSV